MQAQILVAASLVGTLGLAGCASAITPPSVPSTPSSNVDSTICANGDLPTVTQGTVTIATDSPAFPPYFDDDDPSNGKGFESAVAYAVAGKLGYATQDVVWVAVPFNESYAPGDKNFDFDINQISITPKRAKNVTFSESYHTVTQAVVARKDSPVASATTIDELRTARLGAQQGTTSLIFIKKVVRTNTEATVFKDTSDAISALEEEQVGGVVVDLPTAFYLTTVALEDTKIVGQYQTPGEDEEYGLLMAKGSPLKSCVDWAVSELKTSGELQRLQDQWLAGESAPYFQESGASSASASASPSP